MPRLWVDPDAENGEAEIIPLDPISWQPERIEADATGPGRVVLSEIDYPGWQVWVDGKPGLIEKYAGVLRSVKLGAGTHRVRFRISPGHRLCGCRNWNLRLAASRAWNHLEAEAGVVSETILPAQQQVQPPQAAAERRTVLLFALIVMFITTIPYIIGYSAQGDEYRFSGFVFGVEDGNSYIAKMLNGWSGNLLFRSPYTAYPQAGLYFYLPYLLLGKLGSPPALHEQLVALFHLFRIAAGILFICASYDFTARFVEYRRLRYLVWD